MSWAKLDDQIHKNRKLLACSPAARWLYIALITYSRDGETAGQFSRGEMASVAAGQGCRTSHVGELLGAGLIVENDPFYEVPHYDEFNPLTSRERQRKYRRRLLGDAPSDVTGPSPSGHPRARTPAHRVSPSPSPLPVTPKVSLLSIAGSHTREALAICHAYEVLGGVVTPKVLENAEGLVGEFQTPTADEFVAAVEESAGTTPRSVMYFRQRFRELNARLRDGGRKPRSSSDPSEMVRRLADSKAMP